VFKNNISIIQKERYSDDISLSPARHQNSLIMSTQEDAPIYMATVSAPTNIACIKYWGKADKHWNTPTNESVSVTLDQSDLRAVTTAAASTKFTQDRLWLNGIEDEGAPTNKRFRACVDGVLKLAKDPEKWKDCKIHVSSYNTFPTAAGLASSAAGYAALSHRGRPPARRKAG
jgi:diphosphomevalonate decarboxylase